MIRLILTELFMFSAPWVMWWAVHGRKIGMSEAPARRLNLMGLGLALFGLTPFLQQPDPGVQGNYVPAHIEDGRFVPEHFDKAPAK